MCRLAAWIGDQIALEQIVVTPSHSLLTQSHDATEAKLAVNGDGFGFAWYSDDPQPGLFRDVLPAWSDGNLPSLCRMIKSKLFLAHVRASTSGETSRVNCHPFTHNNWAFMHNGQVGNFQRIRRALEASLPDELYLKRIGSTDSELIFLMLLSEGLERDPHRAIASVTSRLDALLLPGEAPTRLTCVMTDGARLIAFRHASDAKAPTMYVREQGNGCVIASEPLDGSEAGWLAVPQDQIVEISAAGMASTPLAVPLAA